MKKVAIYSLLLVLGLVGSQLIPLMSESIAETMSGPVRVLTMIALAFIMIHVGLEFDIDRKKWRSYGVDYGVAMTAAAFPWIFVTAYFIFFMSPPESWGSWENWKEALLAGRFAAPTSAGVLFAMLAAAGLGATWVFKKARILAIFDDLDTVLLMIPLKMMMIGLAWQLGIVVAVMALLLAAAWIWLHSVRIPASWPWVFGYSTVIAIGSEFVYKGSRLIDDSVPIHIEVLLPAFVLGCMIAHPEKALSADQLKREHQVSSAISGVFMVLVGLSMPALVGQISGDSGFSLTEILVHVLFVTVLSNIGKMFPVFCYRSEAHWRERLAVAIGMWPRGEVGAGVLVISLSYGIGGPIIVVAMLSLILNLCLTGVFIYMVQLLLKAPRASSADEGTGRPAEQGRGEVESLGTT